MGEAPGITWQEVAALVSATGVLVGAFAAWLGHRRGTRTAERDQLATEHTAIQSSTQQLIDQLQEEVKRQADEVSKYREAADVRANLADERANMLEVRVQTLTELVTGYRDYAHRLRAHIYEGGGPPPPEWPDGLAR